MAGKRMVLAIRTLVTLCAGLLLAACVHESAGTRTLAGPSIKAMTFNIRLDIASDGQNAWLKRKDLVIALIRHEAPDLLGMQEVLLNQKRDLEGELPEYGMIGVARDDGREAGEFSPLAWRRDRFELVRSGTFWLSPTPQIPGKGWDAALPRIASWAVLRERGSGKLLRVLNTHFDHVGLEAKANSAAQIRQWAATGPNANVPTIVMGDFNSPPGSEPYRHLANSGAVPLLDTRIITATPAYGPRGTFSGFRIDRDAPEPIDHIFVTSDFLVESHATITQHFGGRLPSDHYPVIAKLRMSGR